MVAARQLDQSPDTEMPIAIVVEEHGFHPLHT